jgi:hypothetical protein
MSSREAQKSVEEDIVAQSERYQISERITLTVVHNKQLAYPVIVSMIMLAPKFSRWSQRTVVKIISRSRIQPRESSIANR